MQRISAEQAGPNKLRRLGAEIARSKSSRQCGPSPLDLARDLRLEALGLFEVSGLERDVHECALVDVFEARGDSAVVVPDPVALPKMAWSPHSTVTRIVIRFVMRLRHDASPECKQKFADFR